MYKGLFTAFIFALCLAPHANAWDMDTYVENAKAAGEVDSTETKPKVQEPATTTTVQPDKTFKRHSISVGYGVLTLSDFVGVVAVALIEIVDGLAGKDDGDDLGWLGAITVDYGYRISEIVEVGAIFNYAQPIKNESMYTIMLKSRLNFNSDGFVNPFMELDAGIIFNENAIAPMFHTTFLGLELGRTFPVTLGLLAFGQRGMWYASVGYKF